MDQNINPSIHLKSILIKRKTGNVIQKALLIVSKYIIRERCVSEKKNDASRRVIAW